MGPAAPRPIRDNRFVTDIKDKVEGDAPDGSEPSMFAAASIASRGAVSDATTRGIRVEVKSSFIPDRSSPTENEFFFAYKVKISNVGSVTAKLVAREWIITDAEGDAERVKGPGVVGQQPTLKPGDEFEYTSACPLKTSVGSMYGCYQMVTDQGDRFDAVIAPFTLAAPNSLN